MMRNVAITKGARSLETAAECTVLLDGIRSRDHGAMMAVFDRYSRLIYAVALDGVEREADAEDVMQQVFLQLWNDPSKYDSDGGSLAIWLTVLARHLAMEVQRGLQLAEGAVRAHPDTAVDGIGGAEDTMQLVKVNGPSAVVPAQEPDSLEFPLSDALHDQGTTHESGQPAHRLRVRVRAGITSLKRALSPGLTSMFHLKLVQSKAEMEVNDLHADMKFNARRVRIRKLDRELQGVQRLAEAFSRSPEDILQELVGASADLCGADSAGISLEEQCEGGGTQFRWIAVSGKYIGFRGAVLPRAYSPCGTCLDRGGPQLFRVSKAYLDMIGVEAPPVTDGLLIPWRVGATRGTIWVLAHGPRQVFDREDYRLLQNLSEFAAMAFRQRELQAVLITQAAAIAKRDMARSLAHQINNPLQSLVQTIYLAELGGVESEEFVHQAMRDLKGLSDLVRDLLVTP